MNTNVRDYKSRAEAPRGGARARRGSCFFWLLLGVLLGGFGVGLAWLKLDPGLKRTGGDKLAEAGIPSVPKGEKVPPMAGANEWFFIDGLKDLNVEVPPETLPPAPRQPAPAPAPKPEPTPNHEPKPAPERVAKAESPKLTPPAEPAKPAIAAEPARPAEPAKPAAPAEPNGAGQESYLLQFGAFLKSEEADRLKAQLAMMGVQAQVQRVTVNNQDTYHRLRAGPFTDRKEMDEVRRRLRKANIDSVLVRWRN